MSIKNVAPNAVPFRKPFEHYFHRIRKSVPAVRNVMIVAVTLCMAGASSFTHADEAGYLLQYELGFGQGQPKGNFYFALQTRDGVHDPGDAYVGPRDTWRLSPSHYARIPILNLEDKESRDEKPNSLKEGLRALLGIALIGGSLAVLYKSGDARECAAVSIVTGGYC
ncbi:hypothetical protein ACFL1S_04920 [Pseudomonadota bacterium]